MTSSEVDTHARRLGTEGTETHAEGTEIERGRRKRELTKPLVLPQDSDSDTSHKE